MKTIIFLLFFALVTASLRGFEREERVLVIVADAHVREALVSHLQMEGYHYIQEAEDATADQILLLMASFCPDTCIVDSGKKNAIASLALDTNVIIAAYAANVKKTIVLASFEVYPENTPLPFKEERLLNVKVETETDPYRIAKLTALKACHTYNGLKQPRFFFCPYPTLCGPHDSGFDIRSPHPLKNIAARILRAKWKKEPFAVISNDGRAQYELMHTDDMAAAVVFLLNCQPDDEVINIGYGLDTKIDILAQYVQSYLQYSGKVIFDCTSFDDVPRLVLDNHRMTVLGWNPSISAQDAIKDTVLWLDEQVKGVYDPTVETPFVLP